MLNSHQFRKGMESLGLLRTCKGTRNSQFHPFAIPVQGIPQRFAPRKGWNCVRSNSASTQFRGTCVVRSVACEASTVRSKTNTQFILSLGPCKGEFPISQGFACLALCKATHAIPEGLRAKEAQCQGSTRAYFRTKHIRALRAKQAQPKVSHCF